MTRRGPREAAAPSGVDGRVRRSMRSRELIADALYELVGEGHLEPSAQQVADRAGIAIRSVFRLFADMEALYATIDGRVMAQIPSILWRKPGDGGRDQRAIRMVEERAEIFERFSPFIRATKRLCPRSAFLDTQYKENSRRLRERLLLWLPELRDAPDELLEAADQATSFEAWDRLRSHQRLGYKRAHAVMQLTVLALLDRCRQATGNV